CSAAGQGPGESRGSDEAKPTAVFCGGWPEPGGKASSMAEAADGRRAASSMDRHMSGASLTASREKEGPFPTRLFTSLTGVAPAPRVAPSGADGVHDAAEAPAEAARCLNCQCLECVKVCAYLERYKGYPKKYARQIYNNAAIVQGVHQANRMINSCSLCGLCTEVCPERFSMGDLCLTARRDMVERSKMPPSAHEFALEDMAFNNGPGFALARNEPGASQSAFLFFPGCQLSSSNPHHVKSLYAYLRSRLSGGVGLMLRCCGAPALWSGRDDLFEASAGELLRLWKELGFPRVVAACASCRAVFKEHIPELAPASIWEVLREIGLPTRTGSRPPGVVAVHDPCSLRLAPDIRDCVRGALSTLGVEHQELPRGGGDTECCGYGGLMGAVDPSMAGEVIARKVSESPLDYAASCSMCRDRLAAAGKRAWHVLDFVFPGPEVDPAAKGPGYSDRHERRARLKADLLREAWGEDAGGHGAAAPLLEYAPGVAETLEQRRILREDVEAVVAWAERTGRKLVEKGSGRILAYHRPRRVTYWVEYFQRGESLVVTRAWSHRMDVPGAAGEEAP
ncbi:MAG TPA: (Fe-S)-binding protein, partial [Holophagaceae bacterium]